MIDERWGYINIEGKEVISCIYDYATDFHHGHAEVGQDGNIGIIDRNGKLIIALQDKYSFDILENGFFVAYGFCYWEDRKEYSKECNNCIGYVDIKGTQYWDD